MGQARPGDSGAAGGGPAGPPRPRPGRPGSTLPWRFALAAALLLALALLVPLTSDGSTVARHAASWQL